MIDITKQYRTRGGIEVRIYAVDGADDFPVHGAIKDLNEAVWRSYCWNSDGVGVYSDLDLIEVKPRIKQREQWKAAFQVADEKWSKISARCEQLEAALRAVIDWDNTIVVEDEPFDGPFLGDVMNIARKALEDTQ